MKRLIIGVCGALLALVLATSVALAFGMRDVEKMHDYGVPDSLIISKIHHSGAQFHLRSNDLAKLQKAGISNEVVGAMLATEKPEPQAEVAGPVYVYDDDPWFRFDPWYPFGPPYYPSVIVRYNYGPPFHPRAFVGPQPFQVAPGARYKVGPVAPREHT